MRLDADTGNLLASVKKYGYLQELFPKLSFSSALEASTWFMHRALSFDLFEFQWVSTLIILAFAILNSYLIFKLTASQVFSAFCLIVSLCLFSTLHGFGNWALIIYPIWIAYPLLVFGAVYKIYFENFTFGYVIYAVGLVFLAIFIDLRLLLPLLAVNGAVVFTSLQQNKFSFRPFFHSLLEKKLSLLLLIGLAVLALLTVYLLNVDGLHKEAAKPRDAIHWNYFGAEYNNPNVFSYFTENFLRTIQSAFVSPDVISDNVQVDWPLSLVLLFLVSLGLISALRSKNSLQNVLAYYTFFCLLMVLVLALSGIYAFGNIRYQLWLVFAFQALFFLGLWNVSTVIARIYAKRINLEIPTKPICAVCLILVSGFILMKAQTSYAELRKHNANYSTAVAMLSAPSDVFIYDYVIRQRFAAFGVNVKAPTEVVVDRNWIKDLPNPEFSIDLLTKRLSGKRTAIVASTWNENHSVPQKVLNVLKESGFICNELVGVHQLKIWKCTKLQ